MIQRTKWTERQLTFGLPISMLPYYLERIAGTAARLTEKVKGISEEVLSTKLDDKWSVKQNIGHLAEVDEVNLIRIEEMLNGVPIMSSAVFETKQDYNAQPITAVLHYFSETRKKNIQRLKSLQETELVKTSVHPRIKLAMSPVDITWFQAEHDDHHMVRMNEIIASLLG